MKRDWSPPAYARPCRQPDGAAPTVDRAILEVTEHARRLARGGTSTLRLCKLIDLCCLQAAIARQAKHIVDAVRLAPSHQLVVAEAAVGAENDARAAILGGSARQCARSPRPRHHSPRRWHAAGGPAAGAGRRTRRAAGSSTTALIVAEHRAHHCRCVICGTQTQAAFPDGVTAPVQYGKRIAPRLRGGLVCAVSAALSVAAGTAPRRADGRPVRRQAGHRDHRPDQPGLGTPLHGFCRRRARPCCNRTGQAPPLSRGRLWTKPAFALVARRGGCTSPRLSGSLSTVSRRSGAARGHRHCRA
jgi:hypothetical protein